MVAIYAPGLATVDSDTGETPAVRVFVLGDVAIEVMRLTSTFTLSLVMVAEPFLGNGMLAATALAGIKSSSVFDLVE
jgi:hypothetical protein